MLLFDQNLSLEPSAVNFKTMIMCRLCMKERPTFTVKILQRIYTELIIRGFEPETKCLYFAKPVEDDETEDKEAEDVVNEPSKLQLALEKIRHALNSRMRPNINAFPRASLYQ